MIDGLILAFQFLTRIPINKEVDFNIDNLRRAVFFFPFVGMFVGFLAYLVHKLFLPFGNSIAAVFTVLGLIVITGGLHLDGLSDTCDGFFSNKERDQVLEIMSDSRVGAFGVIGLIIVLLLKYVVIGNLGEEIGYVLVFSLGNSRLMQSYVASFKKSAKDTGMGVLYSWAKAQKYSLFSAFIYIVILVLVDPKFLIPLAINLGFTEIIYRYSYKKIGGFTGDILGSVAELNEIVAILSFLGVIIWI